MLGGALQAAGLCYKGAPGQVFYTEYLGNTMHNSDGIALVDNFENNNMNDCASRGWFAGPWVHEGGGVRDIRAWSRRGWCRMEMFCNALGARPNLSA